MTATWLNWRNKFNKKGNLSKPSSRLGLTGPSARCLLRKLRKRRARRFWSAYCFVGENLHSSGGHIYIRLEIEKIMLFHPSFSVQKSPGAENYTFWFRVGPPFDQLVWLWQCVMIKSLVWVLRAVFPGRSSSAAPTPTSNRTWASCPSTREMSRISCTKKG